MSKELTVRHIDIVQYIFFSYNSKISFWGSLIIYKSNELYKFHLSRPNHVNRGGSRTPATSKMKLFVIIVNGWKLSASLWLEKSSGFLRLELFYNFSFNNFNNIAYQIRSVTNILFFCCGGDMSLILPVI